MNKVVLTLILIVLVHLRSNGYISENDSSNCKCYQEALESLIKDKLIKRSKFKLSAFLIGAQMDSNYPDSLYISELDSQRLSDSLISLPCLDSLNNDWVSESNDSLSVTPVTNGLFQIRVMEFKSPYEQRIIYYTFRLNTDAPILVFVRKRTLLYEFPQY